MANTINEKNELTYQKSNVGIIGYWFASNYGGVASYYSLYRTIEKMGYTPFFIDNPYFETDKEGYNVFSRDFFINQNILVAPAFDNDNLFKLNEFTDVFLLGSDQVLTTSSIKGFGKLFLMDFASNNKRRIAYSASCGGDNLNSDNVLLNFAKNNLRKFDNISVREYSAVDILKNKFGIETQVLIDPIFFTKAQEYIELSKQSKLNEENDYLFAYILDPTEDKKKVIEKIADELSLEVKVALDGRKFTHNSNFEKMDMKENTLPELNEFEWLYYLCNSSYIVTDSFHGAVMAIILNKPFIMIANRDRGLPRFLTLAKMFNLGERLVENSNEINSKLINKKINFKNINRLIKQEVKKSITWLKENLSNKNTNTKMLIEEMPLEVQKLYQNFDFIKIRILVTLLRDYKVKHIVLSPGGRDVPIIRMFENNESQFVLHRVTDERSAGYFGLGLATQLKQPVACVCTSGTAVSNFLPAVTEAYYTGIPLIMITADRYGVYLNHGEDQTIPQKHIFDGVVKMEISLPETGGFLSTYQARRDISNCILETTHDGFGPVHINVPIENISIGANVSKEYWNLLPFIYPHILRVGFNDGENELIKWVKDLRKSPRVLVVYGQNCPLSKEEKLDVERFASKYNCVILTDTISNFNSEYSVNAYNMLLSMSQDEFNKEFAPEILISVGGKRLMNDPLTYKVRGARNIRHWHVSPDGKVKDFYFTLSSVIQLNQKQFFKWFADKAGDIGNNREYLNKWKTRAKNSIPRKMEGFNALTIQEKFIPLIPANSMLHLGVGQSFFEVRRYKIDPAVDVYCNMGTNGIDGCTSTFMGQCSVVQDRLCFLLVGDLSFFYDMNSIWNKNINKNVRILLINNNGSGLLKGHNLRAVTSIHNTTAENWVRSTGFEYMQAKTMQEFEEKLKYFLSNESQKALFFEVLCDR